MNTSVIDNLFQSILKAFNSNITLTQIKEDIESKDFCLNFKYLKSLKEFIYYINPAGVIKDSDKNIIYNNCNTDLKSLLFIVLTLISKNLCFSENSIVENQQNNKNANFDLDVLGKNLNDPLFTYFYVRKLYEPDDELRIVHLSNTTSSKVYKVVNGSEQSISIKDIKPGDVLDFDYYCDNKGNKISNDIKNVSKDYICKGLYRVIGYKNPVSNKQEKIKQTISFKIPGFTEPWDIFSYERYQLRYNFFKEKFGYDLEVGDIVVDGYDPIKKSYQLLERVS